MTEINPQPETQPETKLQEFGFTRTGFTGLLINAGFLSPEDTVVRWSLDKDFLAFDVKVKS